MSDLVLYTNPMSRGRIARWMIEETGADYETVVLDYASTMKEPAYLAINPMGKVPAIVHSGRTITECAAICAYLADAFPEAGLAPATGDRADYYRWLFFAAGPFEAASTNNAAGFSPNEQQQRMMGYGNFALAIDAMEQAVAGRNYVAGDRFSAADVYVGSQIGWGLKFGWLETRPAFEHYWAGLADRPAYLRAMEKDDALTPPQPAAA